MAEKSKAVFLDRDGTIIEDSGYVSTPEQVHFIPGSIAAIKKLNAAGFKVIVITNQSGVARGFFGEDMLQTIDKTVHRQILNGGAHLDAIYYCPHHAEYGAYPYKQACSCRKPGTGMIDKAAKDLDLDLARSFLIGDHSCDIAAGKKAGLKTVFVTTGHGAKEQANLTEQPDQIAADLAAAVDWILKGR